jgi:hypothetical protein
MMEDYEINENNETDETFIYLFVFFVIFVHFVISLHSLSTNDYDEIKIIDFDSFIYFRVSGDRRMQA